MLDSCRWPKTLFALIFASSLALSACPTDTDTDDDAAEGEGEADGEGEGNGDANIDDVIDALVSYFNACGVFVPADGFFVQSEPVAFELLYGDLDETVRELFEATLKDNPNVAINDAAIAPCLAAIQAASCDDTGEVDVCNALLIGLQVDGEPCGNDDECAAEGSACYFDEDSDCGECMPAAGDGESCANAPCADGFFCNVDVCEAEAPDEEPTAPLGEGEACEQDLNLCDENAGLLCLEGDNGFVCTAREIVEEGEACDSELLYCKNQATTHICMPTGDGSVCTARASLGTACEEVPICDSTTSICDEGTCVALPGEGEACQDDCQFGFVCEGTCVPAFSFQSPEVCG